MPSQGAIPVVKPPILASECLQEDLAPRFPAQRTAREWSVLAGLCGGAGVLVLGGVSLSTGLLAGLFFACAAAGALPVSYATRAVALATSSTALLVAAFWLDPSGGRNEILVAAGTTLLAAGLFFRGAHRASAAARVLVGMGIVACGGWLATSGVITGITTLGSQWESWLPASLHVVCALLLIGSLLAFMPATTSAGCSKWGAALVVWYVAEQATAWAVARFGAPGAAPMAIVEAADLSRALAVLVGALAWGQVFVIVATARRTSASEQRKHA